MEFVSATRVVIAPYGLPLAAASREACCRILLACGADLQRVIEGDPRAPASVSARLPAPGPPGSGHEPIVLLTRTTSLVIAVLRLRRMLEQAAPHLARAPWLVFHDPESHPAFLDTAAALGALDGDLELAPFWYAPDGKTYLVVSERVAEIRFVRTRIELLLDAVDNADGERLPDSHVRPIVEQPRSGQRRGGSL